MILFIKWQDAHSVDAWTAVADITPELIEVQTVGFFIRETETILTVAGNWNTACDDYSCIMHIPKSCITHRETLQK